VRALIDYRPALRERTGVGEYTHELTRALLAKYAWNGARDALDLFLFSSSWTDRIVPAPELALAHIVDRRVPVSVLNFAWHRLEWPSAESLTGVRFDVAHSLHPLLLPSREAAQVVTIHDLDFLTHPERTRAEIRRDYPALAANHARRADTIIVVSPFTAAEVERRFGVARERIAICPGGAPDWTPRESPAKDGYLLFFGTLEARKNVGALLDAYERLLENARASEGTRASRPSEGTRASRPSEGARALQASGPSIPGLVLAGRATDAAAPWLERIARAPLAGHVRHIGYVAPADKRALYEGARLLVQPSFEEGFGLTVLEAMTAGVPVVASNRGSLPDLLGDAGSLVDPDDASDLAHAIEAMLTDQAYADRCAALGVERARMFRWARTAERVYEAYQRAIERRARRARGA
jgi:glycosyltransferase involved in cell wall biosynthesis